MCVFGCRASLACPSVSRTRWWRGAEENAQTGCPGERLSKQTLEGQTQHQHCVSLLCTFRLFAELLWLCVLRRVRLSTPATPAATPCPVTPRAATATSAGSTEAHLESEEAWVASVNQPILTPTSLTRAGPTIAASTPRPTTETVATVTCPTASPTRPCTALRPTVASRSCRWEGAAAAGGRLRDESLRPLYQLRPIRTKGTGRGRSLLLAPALIKWMLSSPGKWQTPDEMHRLLILFL